jgi:hypothetical protein
MLRDNRLIVLRIYRTARQPLDYGQFDKPDL